jgi:protein-S-isoprenylcysteine O-methyltransferase Ste14
MGLALFVIAGTFAWLNGWLFLVVTSWVGILTSRAINNSPGLAEERRTAARTAESWDRAVVTVIGIATVLLVGLAACDRRVHWFPGVPVQISIAASVLALTTLVTYREMSANAFFSRYVRLQTERGHAVVSTGPYRFVRHPGYAGSIVFNLLLPLILGSWLAFAPAIGIVLALVWRTAREDRFLTAVLPGYEAYAGTVRYRLIPGLW